MSERTSYTPGTPSWVDLATPDIEASAAFYKDLFGWDVPERENSAEMGGYRRAEKDGADVAGMLPLMAEGQPPVWTTYIAVEDADATAAKVTENGGTVLAPPMDVMDLGRLAVFTDSTGAAFGIWQAGTFVGAARVNEPGALAWNELGTRDPEAAKAFYGAVFGWSFRDLEMKRNEGEEGPSGPEVYTEWLLDEGDENSVAGMLNISGMMPDEIPAHWLAYFAVEDTDAAVATVKAAGGGVAFGPIDIPAGRFAVVSEPNSGAAFAVIALPS
jgi:predicted enzyme related to lactoylglutathione lyase